MEEAFQHSPRKNILRLLRRATSARPEPRDVADSDGDSTLSDSDEDASLVSPSREQVCKFR